MAVYCGQLGPRIAFNKPIRLFQARWEKPTFLPEIRQNHFSAVRFGHFLYAANLTRPTLVYENAHKLLPTGKSPKFLVNKYTANEDVKTYLNRPEVSVASCHVHRSVAVTVSAINPDLLSWHLAAEPVKNLAAIKPGRHVNQRGSYCAAVYRRCSLRRREFVTSRTMTHHPLNTLQMVVLKNTKNKTVLHSTSHCYTRCITS